MSAGPTIAGPTDTGMLAPGAGRTVAVRPLEPGDDRRIACLFEETMLLGAPLPTPLAAADRYRHLCLGWYLGAGRADAAAAVGEDGAVVGYALVCADEPAAARFADRAAIAVSGALVGAAVRGRLDTASRSFYRARLRDGVELRRRRVRPPADVHAHLNVIAGRRRGPVALALVDHIDGVCRRAGRAAWYGEMNERVGRRARAMERLGVEVVHRAPNHTLSLLLGEPVERFTILRRISTTTVRTRDG